MNRTSLRRIAAPSVAALALGLASPPAARATSPAAPAAACPAPSRATAPAPRSPPQTPGAPASRRPTPASPSTTTPPAPARASPSSTAATSTSPAPTPPSTRPRARSTRPRSAAAPTRSRSRSTSARSRSSTTSTASRTSSSTPKTIADIFDSKITKWNDPEIAALNPGAKLPSTRISPVHRSDASGTTKNFTDYLAEGQRRRLEVTPADKVWPYKPGEAANGTSGVVSAVKNGAGLDRLRRRQPGRRPLQGLDQGRLRPSSQPSADGAAKAARPPPRWTTPAPRATWPIKVDRTTTAARRLPADADLLR